MKRSDPLDMTTIEASRRSGSVSRVPTLQLVYRGEAGVVREGRRRLKPGETRIGRGEPDIPLDDDPLASRDHARLRHEPSGHSVEIEDRTSRNGVFVNEARVTRQALVDGDVIRVGGSFFVFRQVDPRQVDVPNDLISGQSPEMQALRVAVKRAGPFDATVLISGETGAGKEVVARALHAESGRRGRFVAINCSAISEALAESELFGHQRGAFTGASESGEGLLRAATGGTVFLDEVGDMALRLQPKLLRAVELGEVTPVGGTTPVRFDARVVAASNVDLPGAIAEGSFREDLYARLAQVAIEVPPLRARREDVLLLLAEQLGADSPPLAPSLVERLLCYDWPRNVRELIAVATELRVWGASEARLTLDLVEERLPASGRQPAAAAPVGQRSEPPQERAPSPSRDGLVALLQKHAGNIAAVADEVGRSRTQIYRWLKEHDLDAGAYR